MNIYHLLAWSYLFQSFFDVLCPTVLSIINDSLQTGVTIFNAAVTPVPEKENATLGDCNNFRPISNLLFLAKILKRIVASHLYNRCIVNNLFNPLQSVTCWLLLILALFQFSSLIRKQHWDQHSKIIVFYLLALKVLFKTGLNPILLTTTSSLPCVVTGMRSVWSLIFLRAQF